MTVTKKGTRDWYEKKGVQQIAVYMPIPFAVKLRVAAAMRNISRSELMKDILTEWVKENS